MRSRSFSRGVVAHCAVVLGVFAAVTGVSAQSTPSRTFRRLPDDAGLSHNSVHAIRQDRAGYLWVGTADGLNRYDGYEFRTYRHDDKDSTSLSSNLVWDLLATPDGSLWVATGAGVDRYDPDRDAFVRMQGPFDARVMALWRTRLHTSRDGVLRAATPAGLLRLAGARFEPAVIDSLVTTGVIRELDDDSSGTMWARLTDGRIVNLETGALATTGADVPSGAILFDRRGRLHATLVPAIDRAVPAPTTALLESRDGTIWYGTATGLVGVDTLGRVTPYRLSGDRQGYIFDYVQALHEDRAGTLWVGTNGGLVRSDPNAKLFTHLGGDPGHPGRLTGSAVSAIATDSRAAWVGTLGSGLNRIDRASGRIERWQEPASGSPARGRDVIWALQVDRSGTLWIGAGSGLRRLDPGSRRIVDHPVAGFTGAVQVIREDSAGRLWLLGARRLVRLSADRSRADSIPLGESLEQSSPGMRPVVESMMIARDGAIWIGAGSSSLLRVDPASGTVRRYPLADTVGSQAGALAIWDLLEAGDGTIWAGMGAGLGRLEPATGRFRLYTPADGLPGSAVFSIEEDADGQLWAGTNQGLARVTVSGDRIATRTFGLADGTGNVEFNRRASLADGSGEFLFGGVAGLTRFIPRLVRDNPFAPPIVLTTVQSIGPSGTRGHGSRVLSLSHRENTVALEFAALSFTNASKNRYRYRLEGVDADWVDAGNRRFARYAGLPPGHYRFEVLGSNEDGAWSTVPATLSLTIRPPFWATWWFRALLVLSLATAAVSLYRRRVDRLLAVERLRLRIAGDLHDDLASDLTGIALLGESVQQSGGLGSSEREAVLRITEAARRLSRDVRDIVWAVDPGHDRLADLTHHLREVTSALLADLPHTFEASGLRADTGLPMRVRRQVLLVLKEALHNIRRHAGATHVDVRLTSDASALHLTVQDHGRGFDTGTIAHRFGLEQMRRRATDVGGSLDLTSRPGDGTCVHLSVPIARRVIEIA